MLMVGMATTVAGLGLLNLLSLGAAVLLGGKTVRDEKNACCNAGRPTPSRPSASTSTR